MHLEDMLISLYVLVDEWWQQSHPLVPRRPGRPPLLSPSEVLTLVLTRLAAKVAASTCGQMLNAALGRPLRQLADLLV